MEAPFAIESYPMSIAAVNETLPRKPSVNVTLQVFRSSLTDQEWSSMEFDAGPDTKMALFLQDQGTSMGGLVRVKRTIFNRGAFNMNLV